MAQRFSKFGQRNALPLHLVVTTTTMSDQNFGRAFEKALGEFAVIRQYTHAVGQPDPIPSMLEGESLKRLLQGAAAGAVATIFVGFYWGG